MGRISDKITEKVIGGAGSILRGKINSTIKKLIKENRLTYLDREDGAVEYINKQGEKAVISLDELAMILVTAAGVENLLNVGILPEDVKEMLIKKGGK